MSKVLVNIHGAGKEMSDFYVEGLNALGKLLGANPPCLPCWYADLSNIGSPVFDTDATMPPDALAFRAALRKDIRERRAAIEAQQPNAAAEFGVLDNAFLVADLVADVTRYLFDPSLQIPVQKRLSDVLAKAATMADETILVSHSLGTVVAYDVLRAEANLYKVTQFWTLGSPLRKVVQLGRRAGDCGALTIKNVPLWRNLYDTTDPVADAIGPAFPCYPIQDTFVNVADAPIPSHDYWRNAQTLQMIADALR